MWKMCLCVVSDVNVYVIRVILVYIHVVRNMYSCVARDVQVDVIRDIVVCVYVALRDVHVCVESDVHMYVMR